MNNISMIVAVTEKTRAIGCKGKLLFNIAEDLKYFKEKTLGHTVVMGYNTYMSLPKRPLAGRKNIVLSRSKKYIEGASVLSSFEELLEYAKSHKDEIFISGGEAVYKEGLKHADKLYITYIEEKQDILADTFFPEIDEKEWEAVSEIKGKDETVPKIKFVIYERRAGD